VFLCFLLLFKMEIFMCTPYHTSTHRPDDAVEELTVSVADVEHDAPVVAAAVDGC
jgi:hypothetical protein